MASARVIVFTSLLVPQCMNLTQLFMYYRRRHHNPIVHLRPAIMLMLGTSLVMFSVCRCITNILQNTLPIIPMRLITEIFVITATDAFLIYAASLFLAFRRADELLGILSPSKSTMPSHPNRHRHYIIAIAHPLPSPTLLPLPRTPMSAIPSPLLPSSHHQRHPCPLAIPPSPRHHHLC